MSILLSVNPPFAGWLVDGEKTIEWRTKPLPIGQTLIYETKKGGGCAKVIGEVTVWASYKVEVDEISDEWLKYGKVDREFLKRYAGGKPLYANLVEKAKRYDKPISVTVFLNPCGQEGCICCPQFDWGKHDCKKYKVRPPQSWCYVEDLKGESK